MHRSARAPARGAACAQPSSSSRSRSSLGCATSPLGRRQLRLMSGDDVSTMGVSAFQEIKKETPQSTRTADSSATCAASRARSPPR